MLARIAEATEAHRPPTRLHDLWARLQRRQPSHAAEAIAEVVEQALETVPCAAIFVPTRTGSTARMISRFNPPIWIVAISATRAVCQSLSFAYGVFAVEMAGEPGDWRGWAREWMRERHLEGKLAMLVAGPSERHPEANHRIEFMRLGEPPEDPQADET